MKQDILTIIIKCGELMIHYFINPLNPIQLPTISEFGGYLPLPPFSSPPFNLRIFPEDFPSPPSPPTLPTNRQTQ